MTVQRTGVCVCVCIHRWPERLTADLQEQVLVVLTDGVAGGAEVLAGVGELDVLQGERGDPGVATHHDVPVQVLKTNEEERNK